MKPHDSAPRIVYAGGFSGDSNYPVHQHENAWELIYLRDGCIDEVVGDSVLALNPGMFVVHAPGVPHGDIADSRYFLFHILVASDHPDGWPKVGCDLEGGPIGSLMGMIVHDWHNGWSQRESFLRHSGQMLDILMKRCLVLNEQVSTARRLVAQARGLLRRNFRQTVHMGELATELGVSRSTLYAHFHQVLGRTPQDVLDEIRQKHAVFLLRHSQLSISEIAANSGFCSTSHLTRKLRETYRMTASELRRAPRDGGADRDVEM